MWTEQMRRELIENSAPAQENANLLMLDVFYWALDDLGISASIILAAAYVTLVFYAAAGKRKEHSPSCWKLRPRQRSF